MTRTPVALGARDDLAADCSRCVGLCCVALAFARSADFPVDKAAGDPCVNLADDFACRIHPTLRDRGFKGCTVFDCFGAGQKVTQEVFGGASWRDADDTRDSMFTVFPVVRQLQEVLWYLACALELPAVDETSGLQNELQDLAATIEAITRSSPAEILAVDLDAHRGAAGLLLRQASALARGPLAAGRTTSLPRKVQPGADLLGADLAGLDLRGADLRGSLLIAADLRASDLGVADLLGADLRDARLNGADLSGALFVTQVQLNAASGDASTRIPVALARPSHWA